MYEVIHGRRSNDHKFRTLNQALSYAEENFYDFHIFHYDEGEVAYRVKGSKTVLIHKEYNNKEVQDEP